MRSRCSRRFFSTQASFDGEFSRLYKLLSKQHKHEKGPWMMMLRATGLALEKTPIVGRAKVLDLASGAGEPGITIARQFPQVDVILTDISSDQIEIASKRSEGMTNVSTRVVDMNDLSTFSDETFDIVTACYGYSFSAHKQKAFNETYRVLKPGSSVIFTYWKKLQIIELSNQVIQAMYQNRTFPQVSVDPMSLSGSHVVQDYLVNAGFCADNIITEQSKYPFDLGSDKEVVYKLGVLPIYAKLLDLKARGKDEELKIGEETFWKLVSDEGNENISVNSQGRYKLHDNIFEMAIARKGQ